MYIKKYILEPLLLVQILLSACSFSGSENKNNIYTVNTFKNDKHYYHMMYELNSDNVIGIENLTNDQFKINGGQFEVLLNSSMFPIDAPNCKSNIILRMPWSDMESSIDKKYELYKKIWLIKIKEHKVTVAIELNPYVEKNISGVNLTNCNIFFRTASGEYIPNINSIKKLIK